MNFGRLCRVTRPPLILFIPSLISLLLLLFFSPLHHTHFSRVLPDSIRYEPHSDLCCCRGRHLFTPCSRSPPPISRSVLHSGLLLCLQILHVPIRPPSTPDPRTMDPSGRCHATSLPRTQHVLCRGFRLVVARSQSVHIRRGGSSSRYTRDVKHDPSVCGIPSRLRCGLARALSQDHPWHPPFSRMDGLRVTAATCHGGSVTGITSAQRAPESVCGYCTFLLLLLPIS